MEGTVKISLEDLDKIRKEKEQLETNLFKVEKEFTNKIKAYKLVVAWCCLLLERELDKSTNIEVPSFEELKVLIVKECGVVIYREQNLIIIRD